MSSTDYEYETVFEITYQQWDYELKLEQYRQIIPEDINIRKLMKQGFWQKSDKLGSKILISEGYEVSVEGKEELIWIPPHNILGIRRVCRMKR